MGATQLTLFPEPCHWGSVQRRRPRTRRQECPRHTPAAPSCFPDFQIPWPRLPRTQKPHPHATPGGLWRDNGRVMQNPASSRSLPRVVTAVALATDGDGAPRLPTRMRILKWGDNPNSQGVPVRVGPRLVAAMREPTYPFRQIALDYEHNTWPGSNSF